QAAEAKDATPHLVSMLKLPKIDDAEALKEAAKDLDTAVEALGKIGPDAVPALVKALEGEFAHLGGSLTGQEAVLRRDARLVTIKAIRKINEESTTRIGGGALLQMSKLKNDPYAEVKAEASKAFTELQKPKP